MRSANGFTLIELMMVLAIFGIIAAFAAPNFTYTIERNQIASVSNEFYGLLRFSRSEAIRSRQRVVSDTILNGTDIVGARAWFEQSNPVDSVFTDGVDTEIRQLSFKRPPTITNALNVFNGDGSTTASSSVAIKICLPGSIERGNTITVLTSGVIAMNGSVCP